ncbi:MAG: 5-formyltetrahydrofolate cyclo-ligase [Phycisphaerales bacterium]|nr:MAG: 5-formyltetrahydrofolate cyclo-ligase [Phycisphaerales bacterium]
MSESSAESDKLEMRQAIRARLTDLGPGPRHDRSVSACRRLAELDWFRHASVVMIYMPMRSEIDLSPIALKCFQAGKTVCVPRVDWNRNDMYPVEVESFDDRVMETDDRGLRTPRAAQPVAPDMIDMIVVPALAYDAEGRRLGRGGGYYDRFLPRLRPETFRVGLVFDQQIVDEVPVESHDKPVDAVVTDRRTMLIRPGRVRRP